VLCVYEEGSGTGVIHRIVTWESLKIASGNWFTYCYGSIYCIIKTYDHYTIYSTTRICSLMKKYYVLIFSIVLDLEMMVLHAMAFVIVGMIHWNCTIELRRKVFFLISRYCMYIFHKNLITPSPIPLVFKMWFLKHFKAFPKCHFSYSDCQKQCNGICI
jgi:hypothetical protein